MRKRGEGDSYHATNAGSDLNHVYVDEACAIQVKIVYRTKPKDPIKLAEHWLKTRRAGSFNVQPSLRFDPSKQAQENIWGLAGYNTGFNVSKRRR